VQRQVHDLGDCLVTDQRFATASFGHLTEPDQSVFLELATPGQHGRPRHPDHLADLRIRHTIGGQQQCLCALHHPVRRRPRTGQGFQDFSLPIGYRQRRRCSTYTS
jgi:hypothetical protein